MSKLTELYASITESIIRKLETAGSWQKLWDVPSPRSLNGYRYRGINFLLLSSDQYKSPVYGTFKQIRENGGAVNRGEKATMIVFWSHIDEKNPETGKTESKWFLKFYYVFNTEQATFDEIGQAKIASMTAANDNPVIQSAESIYLSMPERPVLVHDQSGRASYSRYLDRIRLPELEFFKSSDSYYHTLFHELVHSTGIKKRLDRFQLYKDFDETHMTSYSKEELVAELGGSYLATIAGIDPCIDNSAAYIKGWSQHLKDNTSWIVWAANRAQEAANFIIQYKEQEVPA